MKKANAKISWICFLFPKISYFPLKVIILTFLDELTFEGIFLIRRINVFIEENLTKAYIIDAIYLSTA